MAEADGSEAAEADSALTAAIRRAQQGDEEAFRQVYRTVQPRLLNYLRAMVGEHDAEDVASEAWSSIARDLRRFHGDAGGFRAWAAAIARHRALTHLRRRPGHVPLLMDELPQLPARDNTTDAALESLGTTAALAVIASLPADQAQAILLRVVIGLDSTTAGKVLGKRPGAVRTAAHRGLRALARHLRPAGSAESSSPPPQQGPTASESGLADGADHESIPL